MARILKHFPEFCTLLWQEFLNHMKDSKSFQETKGNSSRNSWTRKPCKCEQDLFCTPWNAKLSLCSSAPAEMNVTHFLKLWKIYLFVSCQQASLIYASTRVLLEGTKYNNTFIAGTFTELRTQAIFLQAQNRPACQNPLVIRQSRLPPPGM